MPSKRKLQKRKKREKEAKKKVADQRQKRIEERSEINKQLKKVKRIEKLQKEMIAMDQPAEFQKLASLGDESLNQLEKNIEILKGLEKEFMEEQKRRQEINEELEDQGYITLDEKLKATQEEIVNQQKFDAEVGVGGSADYSMGIFESKDS